VLTVAVAPRRDADGWGAPENPDSGSDYDSLKGLGEYGIEANEVLCDI